MILSCYLDTQKKEHCFGCEACAQACAVGAIRMIDDEESFRYPQIDFEKCVKCGACVSACPANEPPKCNTPIETYGGYVLNNSIRAQSTSGGIFTAIVDAWAENDTVIFGAEADGLDVRHTYVVGRGNIARFRKSKYLQSFIGSAYSDAERFLKEGRRVIFSGTPCQIAGLMKYLGNTDYDNLLTAEVVCEGVPTPQYIRKFAAWLGDKHGGVVRSIDYRAKRSGEGGKWDFQMMQVNICNRIDSGKWDFEAMSVHVDCRQGKSRIWRKDRWFNPFWSIWLQHLISRPSCYTCPFAKKERVADITLGDLWGVHLYCPDLYGKNGGASIVFCNTEKGKAALLKARPALHGRNLPLDQAIKYQGPMRNHISPNPRRAECMSDLRSGMKYQEIVKKWAKRPTIKLLFQKYVWGNRQKVWLWNLLRKR